MDKQWFDNLSEAEIDEVIRYLEKKANKPLGRKTSQEVFGPNPFVGISRRGLLDTVSLVAKKVAANPMNLNSKMLGFLDEVRKALLLKSDLEPDKKDRRFLDTAWKENIFYNSLLKTYLGLKKQMHQWIRDENFSTQDQERVEYLVELFLDAFSPTNTLLNPTAVKRFYDTGGKSYVRGAQNLIRDLITNSGMPSQVDKTAFELGKNIGTTAGSVIYRNEVLELIQYKPLTDKVRSRPVLIVPPQINKYYILDLSEKNSIVKYLLGQGMRVFVVSWRNPTPRERHWGMENYIEALDKAVDVALDITGVKQLNAIAACTGGITALTLLGYHTALEVKKMATLTLLVSLYDMDSDSQMGMFADKETIAVARRRSARKGVLEGSEMARVFAWMRPNDLIWNYWVNNYLAGNKPPAFDILYWNSDTTRLPATFHSEVLDMVESNSLIKPGGVKIKGTPIDLREVTSELFSVAGTMDHICPWKGCYRSALSVGKKEKNVFILSQSGHMQCILNLPGNPKAAYYYSDTYYEEGEKWLESAEKKQESWWTYWIEWISKRSGEMKNAPAKLGNKKYTPLYDAPGNYVKEK